jgi:predicted glycoside hydrolase/deacetylase ChbG (UPF0249 family)
MTGTRYAIVNADDFGLSAGINRGIVEAHERGIVTSASLMVDRPGAAEAGAYARERRELGVGLHLELPRLRLPLRARRGTARCASELDRQLDRFRELVGGDPTHIDSHRHRHRSEPARSAVARLAARIGVPARDIDPGIRHCGDFYGQSYGRIHSTRRHPEAVGVDALVAVLEELPAGVTEICCHPGYVEDLEPPFRQEPYRDERVLEVRTLCDERVRLAVERLGIELCSFRELGRDGQRRTRYQST